MLGGCILLVVGALSIMPPAVHEQPNWPFASRLSWEATKGLPGVRTSVAIGIQVSLFGFFVALIALITRIRRWPWILAAGVVTIGVGFWLWLPKLTIDAYPTTYVRPSRALQRAVDRPWPAALSATIVRSAMGRKGMAMGLRPLDSDLVQPTSRPNIPPIIPPGISSGG